MPDAALQVIESPLTSLFAGFILGALAMSGKLDLKGARFLLAIAWGLELLALWRSPLRSNIPALAFGICIVTALVGWLFFWLGSPKAINRNKLIVQDIVLGQFMVSQPYTATVYFKNTTGRVVKIKNIAFTQTRPYPRNRAEEKENEDAMWSAVTSNVTELGRDAEVPTMGNGEFNQILETAPITLPEFLDIARGNHAVYFAMLTREQKKNKSLIELCFFVGAKGTVHYCSTHNRP